MYDLVVVGGGFTGVAAACRAAEKGLQVLLVEKAGFLGGAACNSYVNPFMNYHITMNGERKRISDGFFSEVLDCLEGMGGLSQNGATFNEEILKLVFDRMVKKYHVDVLLHTFLIDAECDQGSVKSITVANKSGQEKIYARYFVDATGDADLSALAGFEFQIGREEDGLCQPMTLCFRVADIDMGKITPESWKDAQELYKNLREQGKIKNPREDMLRFPHVAKGVAHFNSTRVVRKNPINAWDISHAEQMAREQMYELYCFLRENVAGFEHSTLLSSAPEIGVRESRRIMGEHVLTQEELKACTVFEDAIAASNYDIDIHNPAGSGTSHYYFKEGEYYTIPYRCLLPRGAKNLLVAGRCISSTHEAQASYRIMPVCCTLGEAAGVAIGVCAEQNAEVSSADVHEIQERLKAYGAFL